jgi:hypothetical protein
MEKQKEKRGGRRPNQTGRPKGSGNKLTTAGLLDQIQAQTSEEYEALLVKDFLQARANNDKDLVIKYHNLILNKVMATQSKIEVERVGNDIEAKQLAFQEALAKLNLTTTVITV